MPELKHAFSAGRMNKDLDERLVPNGEYRDATNIEISTSEGSNTGVVQSLRGNFARRVMAPFGPYTNYDLGTDDNSAVCVGSVTSPDTDKIYYLVNSEINANTNARLNTRKNYILEYDTISETIKYVFVDIFYVRARVNANVNDTSVLYIQEGSDTGGLNFTGIRVGMTLSTTDTSTYTEQMGIVVTDIAWDSAINRWEITLDQSVTLTANDYINFTAESVLKFTPQTLITGINILDEFLFFTDNETEPKKINIKRSILGTGGTQYLNGAGNGGINGANNNAPTVGHITFNGENAYFHTRLVIDNYANATPDYMVVRNDAGNEVQYVEEAHVTVIRKAPPTPLSLDMYRTSVARVNTETNIENPITTTSSNSTANFTETNINGITHPLAPGQSVEGVIFDSPVDFRVNDVILFAGAGAGLDNLQESYTENIRDVRAKVISAPDEAAPNTIFAGPYTLEVLSIKPDIVPTDGNTESPWMGRLEDKDPLFNFKFPRFSYRYKFEDGEYSPFAPFSEVAFLPDFFDYQPKKGHNLGMKNQLRGLSIKGYHPTNKSFPRDVVEIDILYKETNNPTVYTVKTISKKDGHPIWPDDQLTNTPTTGVFNLETDMIHTIVPSNQLIRPYDNVPKKALAQDISANRLIYGNYYQNFDVHSIPDLNLSISSQDVYGVEEDEDINYALPSVKSMRDYQVGIVFSDKYGRETPVLTSKRSTIRVPKSLSASSNQLSISLPEDSVIPTWAEYYSFYIKESTVEYYTLSMDRWYNAADGNIWLSFPSADRNKLMEEDFLILKKAHGDNDVVYEKAKYRILAIENEAPDFIKTRRISLGSVENDDDNTNIGLSNVGFPLPFSREILIEESAFFDQFGEELHKQRIPKNLFLRVTGIGGQTSRRYRIAQIAHYDSGSDDSVKLTVEGEFGPDMAFTSTLNSFDTAIDGLAVELIEEKIINAPEFDGRFFVKIFKDDALSDYVATMSADQYYVTHAWNLGYINNHGYVNAGMRNQAFGDDTFTGSPVGYLGTCPREAIYPSPRTRIDANNSNIYSGSGDFMGRYTSYKYTFAKYHPTEHNWETGLATAAGYNGSSYATGAQYEWFQQTLNSSYFLPCVETMDVCAVRSIGGVTLAQTEAGNSPDFPNFHTIDGPPDDQPSPSKFLESAKIFWEHVHDRGSFFIDCATAYQLGDSIRELPGNRFSTVSLMHDPAFMTNDYDLGALGINGPSVQVTSYDAFGFSDARGVHHPDIPTGYDWPWGFAAHGTGNFFDEGPYAKLAENHAYGGNRSNTAYPFDFASPTSGGPWEGWLHDARTYNSTEPGSSGSSTFIGRVIGQPFSYAPTSEEFWQWVSQESALGTPSRGIWHLNNDTSVMDISWSCWSQDGYNTEITESETDAIMKLSDWGETNSPFNEAAWNFMQELVTPGTTFRFKRDPDQIVYTSRRYEQPYVSDGYDSDYYASSADIYTGTFGIVNYVRGDDPVDVRLYKNETNNLNFDPLVQTPVGTYTGKFGASFEYEEASRQLYVNSNRRQRWTIVVEPRIGSGPSGYNPIHGTDPNYGPGIGEDGFRRALRHDNTGEHDQIQIVSPFTNQESVYSDNSGIWETEPRESVDLDIYYQASRLIPINLNRKTIEEYVPIGTTVTLDGAMLVGGTPGPGGGGVSYSQGNHVLTVVDYSEPNDTTEYFGLIFDNPIPNAQAGIDGTAQGNILFQNDVITLTLSNNTSVTMVVAADVESNAENNTVLVYGNNYSFTPQGAELYAQKHTLGWNNCWCFGNGVESDRIRDDFNAPQMDNGVKASATLGNRDVEEEHKKYGMIWSGIYNSISGINETNQFIAGEKITKDVNPSHGSIQALKTRDTRLTIFCEDKVLKAVTNRDALYNADGNPQLVASDAVVGDVTTYLGDYGISTNPESLAVTPTNMYFTDAMRGKVLALSGEGVRAISDVGMKDYFADAMDRYVDKAVGTYDERKKQYNVTLQKKYNSAQFIPHEVSTVSYSENSKGWSSFKTFHTTVQAANPAMIRPLEGGETLNNKYYTFYGGHIWQHHFTPTDEDADNGVNYNSFYGSPNSSDITVLFNDAAEEVKSFGVINYEGSQARITAWDADTVDSVGFYNNDVTTNSGTADVGTTLTDNVSDGEYYNLTAKTGWFMESLTTNLQTCGEVEFKDKEGKYYGYPTGETTTLNNLDEQEFSVQGLGIATLTHDTPTYNGPIVITLDNNTSTTYNPDTEADGNTDGVADDVWDSTAD